MRRPPLARSVGDEGGEWMPELAALRGAHLRTDEQLRQLDVDASHAELSLSNMQRILLAGPNPLPPSPPVIHIPTLITSRTHTPHLF